MNIPPSRPAPIFILSCNRSGSSLLRYIVDTHPDIASPSELNIGEVCKKLHNLVSQTLGETLFSTYPESEKNSLVLAEVRCMIMSVMDKYIAIKGKKIWCEKSPYNLQFLPLLKAVFPNAKFICLYRHAMDVVQSCLESSRLSLMPDQLNYVCQNSGSIIGAMVQNWIEKNQKLLEFEQENPTQCFHIIYESYTLHPTHTLKQMFEFLGVDWDAKMLSLVFSVHHDLGPEDPKVAYSKCIRTDSIGKGAQIDFHHIPPQLLEAMNKLLVRLNYPVVDDQWGITSYDYLFSTMGLSSKRQESSPVVNIAELLTTTVSPRIRELNEELKGCKVVYKIVVTGKQGGVWIIDPANADNPVRKGNQDANCTLTFSTEDAPGIINGTLNPVEQWMKGKLHVAGDRTLAEIFCWFLVGRLRWRPQSANSNWWL